MFGLYENEGFKVTGVSDVQALQKKVMEQCNQMEPPVRAVFTSIEIDGKYVVSAGNSADRYFGTPVFQ